MDKQEKVKDYKSIGGWLMVLQVFILLNGISWLRNIQLFFGLLGEKEKLIDEMHISAPGAYTAFIYFEIVAAIVMLLFTITLIYYMFKMAKVFKLLVIIYVAVEVVLEFLVYFLFGPMLQTIGSIPVEKMAFSVVIAGLITFYILTSIRVKETFVR
ncbi:MAG: DUF2569 family protein [Ignavibacteriae bacterium]|nr:MAG: DUF2569 family protein [Ignavibacteriota bacterium]